MTKLQLASLIFLLATKMTGIMTAVMIVSAFGVKEASSLAWSLLITTCTLWFACIITAGLDIYFRRKEKEPMVSLSEVKKLDIELYNKLTEKRSNVTVH